MNLPTAIEILTDQYKRHKVGGDLNYRDAIKLGIEALKELKQLRDWRVLPLEKKLPGETED